MQALRHATFFARFVLAWFVLSLGVAIASPVVKPQAIELICSGAALKLGAGSDGQPSGPHALDCPLCAPLAAPPPAAPLTQATTPLADAVRPILAVRIDALARAPFPARGPPAPRTL